MKLLNLLWLTDLQWCSFAPACNALVHQKVWFLEKIVINSGLQMTTMMKIHDFLEQLKQIKEQI